MDLFTSIGDVIIFIGAVVAAIVGIWKFFTSIGKGVKDKVDETKEQARVDEEQRIRDVIALVQEEQADAKKEIILGVLKEALPDMLKCHDAERDAKLDVIDKIKDDVAALAESAKDVLREKIMAIYHRNKKTRKLEEHENEALVQYYKDYKAIKGNSYIDKYYNRMKAWEVIPDDYVED